MGKGKESPQPLVIRTALGVSAGAVIALVICLGILAIAAAGIARGWLAEDWSGRITVAAALVGAFIGGVCGQRWYRHPLVGLGSGLVLCLILLSLMAETSSKLMVEKSQTEKRACTGFIITRFFDCIRRNITQKIVLIFGKTYFIKTVKHDRF